MADLLGFGTGACFLTLLFLIERVSGVFRFPNEIWRKTAHILAVAYATVLVYYFSDTVFYVLALVFQSFILLSYKYQWLKSVHGVERRTYGEVLLPVGVVLCRMFLGDGPEFLAGILVLGISDPLAGIVGHWYDKKGKSVVGSSAFFISALVIFVIGPVAMSIPLALVAALFITLVERFSGRGFDNLTIPLTVIAYANLGLFP